jgi:DNA-binding response OmpR family regulator
MMPRPEGPTQILVVDDEPFLVRTLVDLFERHGWRTEGVYDADAALRCFYAERPGVVLTGGGMRGRDGYQLTRALRSDTTLDPEPFVIMLTGGGRDVDRQQAGEVGVDEYVTKPFRPSQLVSCVESVMETA